MGRKRIGIFYHPSKNWIGGAYYVQNIFFALNACEDSKKPTIVVYCFIKSDFEDIKRLTNYPYLECKICGSETKWQNIVRRVLKLFAKNKKKYDVRTIPSVFDRVKFVYPFTEDEEYIDWNRALAWIPDFQERFLPDLFSQEEIDKRYRYYSKLVEHRLPVVLSSQAAKDDYISVIPESANLRLFVLPFAVTHPDYSNENIGKIKEKYGINKPYLFCANQFWQHKNHLFLFKAFVEAKKKGLDVQLVCSGNLKDDRSDSYPSSVARFLSENKLDKDIIITGFISRTEQLCLMKNSLAVVQPSLFEGWSTVVEDAKCMGKFIYLSNLKVHIEQKPDAVCYFDPLNLGDLVSKLLEVEPKDVESHYYKNIQDFGNRFVRIIEEY